MFNQKLIEMIGKEKILIIDDSVTNTVLLNAVLMQEGYNITTAFNIKDALISVEKNTPDLILLDLMMPDVSGYDFLRVVKKNDKLIGVPIIIVSAIKEEGEINAAKELGASDYINKPIDILNFLDKINGALKQKNPSC